MHRQTIIVLRTEIGWKNEMFYLTKKTDYDNLDLITNDKFFFINVGRWKNMKKNLRKENAITLISLVVTIVVLTVLAGISISTINNNGLMDKAISARDDTNRAEIIEQTRLGLKAKALEKRGKKISDPELRKILEKHFSDVNKIDEFTDEIIGSESIFLTSKKGNYQITLKELLSGVKLESVTIIRVGDTNIIATDDLSTLYGSDTDYKSVDNIVWQLFYDDAENVYLIAKDYVPVSMLPTELNKESGEPTQKFKAWFATQVGNARQGTIIENSPWKDGADSSTISENKLTNKYLSWVNSRSISTIRNNPNMKAVAFMMDTNKWSAFAGNATGATAMGGPTLQMFVLSYNAVSSHTTKLPTYEVVSQGSANSNGYILPSGITLQSSNDMWVKSMDKTYGYWLAAPSSEQNTYLGFVFGYSNVLYNDIASDVGGFRPLVSIPKSSLK